MKIKKILFMVICLIVLLVPNFALAAETFTYGDYKYSIEKINLKTDLLTDNEMFSGMDENGNYIFEDYETNKFYKVNENECSLMSNEEVLKFNNTAFHKDITLSGYDIYEMQQLYHIEIGYIKTSDTEINSNKQYIQFGYDEWGNMIPDYVEVPNISEIDTYYEEISLRYPTTTEIDDNTTYYTKDESTKTIIKVDNPISENVSKYRIKVNNIADSWSETKIATLDSAIFEEIFNKYYFWSGYKDEVTNKIHIVLTNGHDTVIYASDGTLVNELKNVEATEFSWYSNSFLAVKGEQDSFKIMDKDANIIFESEELPLLYEIKYKNDVHYLYSFDDETEKFEFYNMYETEIVYDDNDNSNADIDNSINNDNNNAENNNTNDTTTNTNQDAGEKDDTPKTGNNLQIRDNILFAGLVLIAIFAITKFIRK